MTQHTRLDLVHVRRHFPILSGEWAFFDNAAGTLVPRSVTERMTAFMTECQVQPSAPYEISVLAADRLAESERCMAELINAEIDEVVISHSTTMNVHVLAQALRPLLAPGDEIIVTNLDHEANNGAWRRLAEFGCVIREWRFNPDTADLETEDLRLLLNDRTRLVCFTHCSNITGSINDVATIVRMVHEAGALACVDGVAFAPHGRVDVKALDIDFYLCSLYKIFGPHHALLYGKHEHLLAAKAQNHFFVGDEEIPLKLNVGGYDYEVVASLSGITAYFDALHEHHFPGANTGRPERLRQVYDLFAAHEEALSATMLEFLTSKTNLRVVGRTDPRRAVRAPTFSFVVEGRASSEIPELLASANLGADSGHFYAYRVVRDLGYLERGGVVRLSLVHYNSVEEVDRLIQRLDEVV